MISNISLIQVIYFENFGIHLSYAKQIVRFLIKNEQKEWFLTETVGTI